MPKSKELLSSDDDLSSGEEKKVKKPAKKQKVEKKQESEDENAGSDEAPVEKKPKKSASSTSAASKKKNEETNGDAQKDSDGNNMYMLSKMRFVSVSEFRGKPLINIREYYESNGKVLPGKKGISLAIDQWEQLKKFIPKLDEDIKKLK